jgi:tetratricopeptide (TPR) repeat protein
VNSLRGLLLGAVILACGVVLQHSADAAPHVQAAPDSTVGTSLIEQGDYCALTTFDHAKAIELYTKGLAADPGNVELLWRISRAHVEIGEHLPAETDEEKEQQLKEYEKAEAFATKAIAANSKNSMAYTRRAIANGRIALFKGVWESVDLVKSVKADLDTALALDPKNHVALYVMGRTHLKVAEKPGIIRWPLGLSWADVEEGIVFFEKAIALKPQFIMYRLDCARAYIEEDEFEKAREQLTTIETLPNEDQDDDQFRSEAKALLKEIEDE